MLYCSETDCCPDPSRGMTPGSMKGTYDLNRVLIQEDNIGANATIGGRTMILTKRVSK